MLKIETKQQIINLFIKKYYTKNIEDSLSNGAVFFISYCDFIRFFWFDIKSILKNITWLFVSYLYMNILYIIPKIWKNY